MSCCIIFNKLYFIFYKFIFYIACMLDPHTLDKTQHSVICPMLTKLGGKLMCTDIMDGPLFNQSHILQDCMVIVNKH